MNTIARRLLAAAFCLPVLTAPTLSAPVKLDARYVVSVSGNIIAQVDINFDDDGSDYAIDVDASVAGLGQFVASGSARADATGRSTASGLIGQDFNLDTSTNEGRFHVGVTYTGGNVNSFKVDPPLPPRYDRVPIERAQLTGVNDMISAFVLKGAKLDAGLCNRKLKIFTGTERFDLDMHFASADEATSPRTGYQGPVILCQIDYQPISGHFASSEITRYLAESDRILIWYLPVEQSGTFIPYRVLVGTAIGDLSMVLTRLG